MGATKRLAEDYIQTLGGTSCTRFVAVRFGNVLGSVGSVVPLFQEQINKGGPLTVTHPDMVRYFMTIQEACQLVLEAGAIGRGGEILALDMGEPMKILDLARRMIALSDPGQPEDIRIEITGLRPGEKLVEELWFNHEELQTTRCAKIFVHKAGQARERTPQELILGIDAAIKDSGNVRAHIQELVPCYQPNPEVSVAHTR